MAQVARPMIPGGQSRQSIPYRRLWAADLYGYLRTVS